MRRPRISWWQGLAAFVTLLLVVTVATATGRDPALYPPEPGEAVVIYMLDNGFHSDLIVPRAAIAADPGPIVAATASVPGPWVMIGWGDARFYEATSPWQDRIGDGVAALFGGRPTIAHLEGVSADPARLWTAGLHRIEVSPAGLKALLARADRAFRTGPDGAPIPVAVAGREPDEAFFQSGEGFSAFHLCNHWTAQLLHAAGLPTLPVLDTLPAGLALDLRLRSGA